MRNGETLCVQQGHGFFEGRRRAKGYLRGVCPPALVISAFILCEPVSYAQDKEAEHPTTTFLYKRGYSFPDEPGAARSQQKWPATVYYSTEYKATLLGSPTIPYSFAKIERNAGKFQVSPVISLGLGYNFFLGDFIFNETDKITVDQSLCFGPVVLFGLQNDFNLNRFTSVVTGAFIGLGPISLFFGYDYLTQSFSLEFGQRVDFYALKQSFLNPIGRVHPVRHPKREVTPITKE